MEYEPNFEEFWTKELRPRLPLTGELLGLFKLCCYLAWADGCARGARLLADTAIDALQELKERP